MTDHIILDIEAMVEVEDWDRPWESGISCAVAWDPDPCVYKTFRFFRHDIDSEGWVENLRRLYGLLHSREVVTWGSYDKKTLEWFFTANGLDLGTISWFDLAAAVKKAALLPHGFHGLRLDNVSRATLGVSKSLSSVELLRLLDAADYETVTEYCQNDVRILRDLFEVARAGGNLWYSWQGERRSVRLWSKGRL